MSGAGTSSLNGTYVAMGTWGGKNAYAVNALTAILWTGKNWVIQVGFPPGKVYYVNDFDCGDDPPAIGWKLAEGAGPSPSFFGSISSDALIPNSDSIELFPTPAQNMLKYQITDLEDIQRIRILDTYGKLIVETTDISGKILLMDLPIGTYHFVVETATELIQQTFVTN